MDNGNKDTPIIIKKFVRKKRNISSAYFYIVQ